MPTFTAQFHKAYKNTIPQAVHTHTRLQEEQQELFIHSCDQGFELKYKCFIRTVRECGEGGTEKRDRKKGKAIEN